MIVVLGDCIPEQFRSPVFPELRFPTFFARRSHVYTRKKHPFKPDIDTFTLYTISRHHLHCGNAEKLASNHHFESRIT